MKSFAAYGFALSALYAATAAAQSQQGGLPALDARVSQLEATVGNLQAGLDAERAARMAADAALQSALASLQTSVNGQANQIATLQGQVGALNTTVTSLSQSVASLTTTVTGLANDQTFAIFEHSVAPTNLDVPGFPALEVVTTFLPAGNWVIYAHADVWRDDSDGAGVCFISSGPGAGSIFTTSSSAQETLTTDDNTNDRARFVLMSRATLAEPGALVSVKCSSPNSVSPSSSITAIRVKELSASQ